MDYDTNHSGFRHVTEEEVFRSLSAGDFAIMNFFAHQSFLVLLSLFTALLLDPIYVRSGKVLRMHTLQPA
jgi:hypothetical protein